jgi:hypothetical protein
MPTLITTCKGCGQEYELTREDLIKGPGFYRSCPSCRPRNG